MSKSPGQRFIRDAWIGSGDFAIEGVSYLARRWQVAPTADQLTASTRIVEIGRGRPYKTVLKW